jgi:diamine N-acetyltransferase
MGSGQNHISVREGTFEDIPGLVELFFESEELHRSHLPDQFQKPSREFAQDFYKKHFSDSKVKIFVALSQHQLVGFSRLILKDPPALEMLVLTASARLEEIVVTKDLRRSGVGKLLLEETERWLRQSGIELIDLNVYSFNRPAIEFYERNGYEIRNSVYRKRLD